MRATRPRTNLRDQADLAAANATGSSGGDPVTPLPMQLLLPAVVVFSAGLVVWKFSYREYPALIRFMLWCAFFEGYTFRNTSPFPHWLMLAQAAVGMAIALEVFTVRRLRISREAQGRLVGAMFATSALLAGLRMDLTVLQRAYLMRSYLMLMVAAIPAAVTVYRIFRPTLECKRHVIYGVGASIWLLALAGSLSFVPGGLGYVVFPSTMATWRIANLAAYIILPLTVAGMSLAMVASAPGRKRAAMTPMGKTKTGLLETELAA